MPDRICGRLIDRGVQSLDLLAGQGPAHQAEVPMRVVCDGRETWLRVKTADRSAFLRKPQLQ
jgi:hypothetical protein